MKQFLNTKKKRLIFVLICLILIVSIFFLYEIIYNKYKFGIPCIFHKLTGLYCPGCGITRAVFSLLNFKFKDAIHYNLLLFIVVPFILFYLIKKLIYWINGSKNVLILSNKFLYTLLFITLIYGFIRNLDAFSFLAPNF